MTEDPGRHPAGRTLLYTSRGPLVEGGASTFATTRLMVRELYEARGLVWRLFVRDFSARYRQSLLGVAWIVVVTILTTGTFVLAARTGVLRIGETDVPYPLYALIGITFWGAFASTLRAASASVVEAGEIVVKINFPKISLILAAAGQGLVELGVRLVLLAIAFAYWKVWPSALGGVLAIFALVPLLLLAIGLACFLSLLVAVTRDAANALPLILGGVLLMTPVVYPMPAGTFLAEVNRWNPLAHLVEGPRALLVRGALPIPSAYWAACLLAFAVALAGWRFFYLAQTKIAERV